MRFHVSEHAGHATKVFDAFGAPLGLVLRSDRDRLLIGTPGEPALWVARRAVMRTTKGAVFLVCARNHIGAFAIPVAPGGPSSEDVA